MDKLVVRDAFGRPMSEVDFTKQEVTLTEEECQERLDYLIKNGSVGVKSRSEAERIAIMYGKKVIIGFEMYSMGTPLTDDPLSMYSNPHYIRLIDEGMPEEDQLINPIKLGE